MCWRCLPARTCGTWSARMKDAAMKKSRGLVVMSRSSHLFVLHLVDHRWVSMVDGEARCRMNLGKVDGFAKTVSD